MKKQLLSLLSLLPLCLFAQNVHIKGTVGNPSVKKIEIYRPLRGFTFDHFKEAWTEIPVVNGTFSADLTVDRPEIASIWVEYDTTKRAYSQFLFFRKGYSLELELTPATDGFHLSTRGQGASDNQASGMRGSVSFDRFYKSKDTLPFNVYAYIVSEYRNDSLALQDYIRKNKPSPDFRSAWQYEMAYYVPANFFSFSENYKFSIREAYERNADAWKGLQKKLLAAQPLSNDAALGSPVYRHLLRTYILRTKEGLWKNAWQNRPAFLQEWYGPDTTTAWQTYQADMENDLCRRITDKYFTGKTKEYLYAALFEKAIHTSNVKNIDRIYADFRDAYPTSEYIKRFQPDFDVMFSKAKRPLTDKMLFVKNGDKINNWEAVQALMKGKTVLLDMWGTWCGPCREEMENNSAAIKEYFKGKGLDYLYIANHDVGQDDKWKELIAYFNLEGYHILANEGLTKDIMNKIGGTGFPTYAIIKPDGSFELSKAGYPMNRQKLIEQIEGTLK